jgi:hypothetical protein
MPHRIQIMQADSSITKLLGGAMTNSSRKKKLQSPQLEVIETILRELLLEYNSQEVKRMWRMIRHES